MGTLTPRGEKQINFLDSSSDGLTGAQGDPAVTALSNGNFVVVYEDPAAGNVLNADLLAHFFNADGNAIAPPATTSLSNGVVGVDQSLDVTIQPAIAATANGGFVVAYSDETAGTIEVETYNPATGISSPFTVYSKIGHVNTHDLTSASIATFADGNIFVAWDEVLSATDHNVDAAILNPTATGFVVPVNGVTSYPTFQGESRIATFGNTAALVYAADPGTIGGGQDIILQNFNSTGTELHAPTTVFGTSSGDDWSHPDVAALPDGRFVVVAQDDTTGNFSVAVVDPATHTVLSTLVPTAGTNPHVAVTGNGFTVSLDAANGDILSFNFSVGSGTAPVLGTFGNVGSFFTGTQDENAIAANANGSLFLTWQDGGSGNPNSNDADTRIEGEAFRDLSTDHAPVVTAANVTATALQFFTASSLFSVTDADSDTIAAYQFWDDTTDPASGHWVVGGVAQPSHQAIDVTPAQLATATFQSGSGSDDLFVRANDGIQWGNWAEFHVNAPTDTGPVMNVANLTANHGQSFDGVDLFTYNSPFGLATQYDFWDSGDGNGHFVLNGTALPSGQHNIIPASQISGLSYQSGSGADTLWVRANDGTVWGAWSSAFTVTAPVDTGPTIFVADQQVQHGQSIPANSLGLYSDPFNSPGVLFDYWNSGTGGGHFVLNGMALPSGQHNIVNLTQLAQLTYQPGSGADTLWIRANDGTVWGAWSNAFKVTAPIDLGPTLTVGNLTATPGQSIAGSSLFSNYSDPFGSPATQYDFWDSGTGGGQFVFNGAPLAAGQGNIIAATQLSQLSYQAGAGTDTLWVRANDGTAWGAWSNSFTVTG